MVNVDVPVLACRNLQWSFGDRVVLHELSFDVMPGMCLGLLGPNGAGKTTAIKIILGLLHNPDGEAFIGGYSVSRETDDARRQVGYVPQDLALDLGMSCRDNLRFWGRVYGLRQPHLDRRVDEVLDIVGLRDRVDDMVRELSGGMQRRLNLAAGLLGDPALLVLDEPTVGVDPQSRNAILDRLDDLRTSGLAILYASHYMEEVERLCDVVCILDGGRLIAKGSPAEVAKSSGNEQLLTVQGRGDLPAMLREVEALPGVARAVLVDNRLEVAVGDASSLLASVVAAASRTGTALEAVDVRSATLEAVFLGLTGNTLRE